MKIVIDGFGGDNSPNCVIEGVILAQKKYKDLEFVIVGKKDILSSLLAKYEYDTNRVEILDAQSVITNDDAPAESIRSKKDSSIVVAYDYLKSNDDCFAFISAGSTGAVLSGALLKLGRMKGVLRPALAPLVPNKKGGYTLIIDCGANVDSKPMNMCQFAVMGSVYMKTLFGIKNPKVALLNVGVEEHKGNMFTKEVFPLMKELPINFVGNMEARELTSGDYDVVVCDGFSGNVLLKATEGGALMVLSEVKKAIKGSFKAKLGALFMKKQLKGLVKKLDYNKYGGSPFLGCKKTVIKSHGSSTGETILACIDQAVTLNKNKINEKINEELSKVTFEGEN